MKLLIRNKGRYEALLIVVYAFMLTLALYYLQGHLLFNLADEGNLWYGSVHTLAGQVPIRDFYSYDPGRYYWNAFWFLFFGQGILALRISAFLFLGLGLTFALLTLKDSIKPAYVLLGLCSLFALWSYPVHKYYDISIAMMLVYFAKRVLEQTSPRQYFLFGLFIGAAAFFGRNHGFYGVVSASLILIYSFIKIDRTRVSQKTLLWLAGIGLGYTPMLVMFLSVPGFLNSFLLDLKTMFYSGHSNIPLPIPWPWKVGVSHNFMHFLSSSLTVVMPGLYLILLIGFVAKAWRREQAPVLAGAVVGMVYLHYYYARADIGHLMHVLPPLLVTLLAMPFVFGWRSVWRIGFLVGIFVVSIVAVPSMQPFLIKATGQPYGMDALVDIKNDKLWLSGEQARIVGQVKVLAEQYVKDDSILIAPHWPAFYVMLGKNSPVWRTYFLVQESPQREELMLRQMEKVKPTWVLLGDILLDGREDLRFRNTHRQLWQYIREHYAPFAVQDLPRNYEFLKRKQKT